MGCCSKFSPEAKFWGGGGGIIPKQEVYKQAHPTNHITLTEVLGLLSPFEKVKEKFDTDSDMPFLSIKCCKRSQYQRQLVSSLHTKTSEGWHTAYFWTNGIGGIHWIFFSSHARDPHAFGIQRVENGGRKWVSWLIIYAEGDGHFLCLRLGHSTCPFFFLSLFIFLIS